MADEEEVGLLRKRRKQAKQEKGANREARKAAAAAAREPRRDHEAGALAWAEYKSFKDKVEFSKAPGQSHVDTPFAELVAALMSRRADCRSEKKYDEADELLRQLTSLGVTIDDTATASSWVMTTERVRIRVERDTPRERDRRDSRAVLLRWVSELAAAKATMPTDEARACVDGGGGGGGGEGKGGGGGEGKGSRGAAELHAEYTPEHAVVYDIVCVAEARGTKRAEQSLDNAMGDHFKASLDPLLRRIEISIRGLSSGDGNGGNSDDGGGGGGGGDSTGSTGSTGNVKGGGNGAAGGSSTRMGDARLRINGRLGSACHHGRPAEFTDPAELEVYTQVTSISYDNRQRPRGVLRCVVLLGGLLLEKLFPSAIWPPFTPYLLIISIVLPTSCPFKPPLKTLTSDQNSRHFEYPIVCIHRTA